MTNILYFSLTVEVLVLLTMKKVMYPYYKKSKDVAQGTAFLSSALLDNNHVTKLSCAKALNCTLSKVIHSDVSNIIKKNPTFFGH